MINLRVGEVRPSQLLWTYGPGALIDLPNLSVLTMGIDLWPKDQCTEILENRLLAAVQKVLGPQVKSLRIPPFIENTASNSRDGELSIGVPVKPFPRWLRCIKCGLLSAYDLGLFSPKEEQYRPENTRFLHIGCQGSKGNQPSKNVDAVPARFLLACRSGHLDDFPWHYFVHKGPSNCRGTLRFFESGASLQTENLWVKCDQCHATDTMAKAFGDSGKKRLPACRGRHPHLDHYDDSCEEQPRAVLLGATNSWFPIPLSALAIPLSARPISQFIRERWNNFENINSEAGVVTLKTAGLPPGIEKYTANDIWTEIQSVKNGASGSTGDDIKGPEWKVLIDPNPPKDWPHFLSKPAEVPNNYEEQIIGVLLLERLREVNALLGFTRVESPEETGDPDDRPPMARLSKEPPKWVPAVEVHGEGIFIRFDEKLIQQWESRSSVQERNEKLLAGHKGWRNSRNLPPEGGYPGIRYAMLHTMAHLLIRELALECGYNAASIKERVYADTDGEEPQAGILVYTAAADSDGTLGGLVELGKPENLGRLLNQALARAYICSSDPLCSDHEPAKDRSLHAAACHACSFVSETSCEKGNRYLDRALLVPTLGHTDIAFFQRGTNVG